VVTNLFLKKKEKKEMFRESLRIAQGFMAERNFGRSFQGFVLFLREVDPTLLFQKLLFT